MRDDDDLEAARGILLGVLTGCILWSLGFLFFAAY